MEKILGLFLLLSACASVPQLPLLSGSPTSHECTRIFNAARTQDVGEQLDSVSDLHSSACYYEAIALGNHIRNNFRSKFYQVSSELAEVLTPEGTFTNYVLESYERTYLSLVIAMNYLSLKQETAALVELRRAQEEEVATLYNYGADPVLSLLQATLWDRFDPLMARPHWKFLSTIDSTATQYDSKVSNFAKARIEEIDRSPNQKVRWQIVGFGTFPQLDWSTQFLNVAGNSYKITPLTPFPQTCTHSDEILIPTTSWVEKINSRYDASYHPMLYLKSLARLPAALTYGVVGVSAGVAVGFGGCILASQAHGNSGELCGQSIQAAGYLIKETSNIVDYTVKPDLRHWSKVPSAFFVSRAVAGPSLDTCLSQSEQALTKTFSFLE